jgi:putative hydrolase of the HAD superfamily
VAVEERWVLPAEQTFRELEDIYSESPGAVVFDEWLERDDEDLPGARDLMLAAYRANRPELRLFADAAWALDVLGQDHRLGLLTDGRSESQRSKIQALGIADRFEEILVTDEMGLGWRKPSPRGFELLLDRFDCLPGEAVYIADNPAKDFIAPSLLGMGSVRVRRPAGRYSRREASTPAAAAAAEIASLFGLRDALAFARRRHAVALPDARH